MGIIEIWVGQCMHCPFFKPRQRECRWTGLEVSPELLIDGPPPQWCKLRDTDYKVVMNPIVAEFERATN